jgi:hypothetical protein
MELYGGRVLDSVDFLLLDDVYAASVELCFCMDALARDGRDRADSQR